METKHLIALIALVAATCGSMLLATFSQKARSVAFFCMVAFAVFAERGALDVNFLGQYWYRGTSRGIGVSLIDILGWAVLASTLLVPRYQRRSWFLPAGTFFYFIYFLYCTYSVSRAPQLMFGVWELTNIPRAFLIMLASAAFVRTSRELKLLVAALCTAVCIQAVYAVKQRLGGEFRPPGTLDHANSLSMYLCTIAPALLAAGLSDWHKYIRWAALACCGLAAFVVLMTLSRAGLPIFGAVMGGTAIMCTTWKITRKKIYILSALAVVSAAVLAKSWDQIVARFGSATFEEEVFAMDGENRGIYWRWAKMIIDDDPFGAGLNNWSYVVSKTYGARVGFNYEDYDEIRTAPEKADIPSIRYAPPAHALAALTLGELGIPGAILFLCVWLRWFSTGAMFLWERLNRDPMHRMAIGFFFGTCGIFLQSVTEWTYRQPALFLTFHTLMGALASLAYARRYVTNNSELKRGIPVPFEELAVVTTAAPAAASASR